MLTNLTRTHKGIEYRDTGSSIHQAYWFGYDNIRRPAKNTNTYPIWMAGRRAAKEGLYQQVKAAR